MRLFCLNEGAWLNDEIINFHMNMFNVRDVELCGLVSSPRVRSYCFSSFFMAKLLERNTFNYSLVAKWAAKVDLFSINKIFVPINIDNIHWTLLVVYVSERRLVYYDSMGYDGTK